ncbi:OmpA family protein [Zhongshania sp.]|uniref:OmpA family protein n=1 Tax=Zhongshania sp. TaxID=1971902 RepID=UPI0035626C4F
MDFYRWYLMISRLCLQSFLLSVLLPLNAAQAGPAQDLVNQSGILTVVSPVTTAVGIDLNDSLAGADSGLEGDPEPMAEELSSLAASDELLAMDQGIFAADDGSELGEGGGLLGSAKDQPALAPLTNIDPVFAAGRIQADGYQCADGDGDGVCDQDDQCLKTPRGIKTLANGCYIEGPQAQPLEGVYFAYDSAVLDETAKAILDVAVQVIRQSDAQRIEVGGHTDNAGGERYNLRLSDARAKAVRNYLLAQGISAERLVAKGYGEAKPRADNSTAAGREKNRRVELKRL